MKLVEMKCKNCGNVLKLEPEQKDIDCEYCHAKYKLDDEVQHIKYDDMEQAGYEMEKGKIRARKEAKEEIEYEKQLRQQAIKEEEMRKKNLKWWILGWIFMFPIPLTILIWRSKWDKNKKIICTIALWVIILIIGYASPNEPTNNGNNTNEVQENETITKETKIDTFVNEYNKLTENKLVFKENFEAQDEESGHYRTEFRLTAYKNSLGKSYTINNQVIDIIATENILSEMDVRIYSDNVSLEQSIELIRYSSLLLDSTMTAETLEETIKYVKDNKYANGYYYGKLGLLLMGDDKKGYEIMIKTD